MTRVKIPFKYFFFVVIAVALCCGVISHYPDTAIAKTNLTASNTTVSGLYAKTYTGKAITQNPTVKRGKTTLKLNRDYTLTYKNNTNAGTATVSIKGKGNYAGSLSKTFKINPAKVAIPKGKNYSYNGKTQTGVVPNSRYVISGNSATKVGTYTATLKLKDTKNYSWSDGAKGTKKVTWKILGRSISSSTVTNLVAKVYTGKVITQNPTIKLAGATLKKDIDYALSYSNNINAGTATVSIKGKGNYSGSINKTFKIDAAKIAVPQGKTLTYNGKEQVAIATTSHYMVANGSATNVGNYTAAIKLKDTKNYSWSDGTKADKRVSWKIVGAAFTDAQINGIVDKTYTGKTITQDVKVSLNGTSLRKDSDYTLTYKNNTNAGTGTVTISGKGAYSGTITKTFTIAPVNINNASVEDIPATTFTGAAIKPLPVIKIGSLTLKKDTDYTLSYINNTSSGTGTITITGKGNYSGSVNKTFVINEQIPSQDNPVTTPSNPSPSKKWIVDTPAWEEEIWVVDREAGYYEVWHGEQIWVEEIVVVEDSPAWDEVVPGYSILVASDGSEFYDYDSYAQYNREHNGSLSVSVDTHPGYTIHHPAITHEEDHSRWEPNLSDPDGYWETEWCEELGHWETVLHEEVGHWE